MRNGLETPLAFIIFNRPATTERVFAEIATARPRKLLVIADGPRAGRDGEAERCRQTRAIIDRVNWDCEVLKHYSDVNLGCKRRVSSGLDWVFGQVEEAIVLEDDCVPDQSFFPYCEHLLSLYRNDDRVMCISGSNFQEGRLRTPYSYYFSRYSHIWGWASWRRAWKHYDVDMRMWPEVRASEEFQSLFRARSSRWYWRRIFDSVYNGKIDTWDYQWFFSCLINSGLGAIPQTNLVSNIGFGADATHTRQAGRFANLPAGRLEAPWRAPPFVVRNEQADRRVERTMFVGALPGRLLARMRNGFFGSQ